MYVRFDLRSKTILKSHVAVRTFKKEIQLTIRETFAYLSKVLLILSKIWLLPIGKNSA